MAFKINVISALIISSNVVAQELPAYKLYNKQGKELEFEKMVGQAIENDVILFGELHNNPICHWMQLELIKAVHAKHEQMILGAEMFEADDQIVLDEYLSRKITLDHLKKEAKVWPNFSTDYLPLIQFATEKKIPFIATNVPRRYASLVSKRGLTALDSLSEGAKSFMGPLPFLVIQEDSGYIEMREQMGFHSGGMNIDYLIAAQALKDHTMAHRIVQNRKPEQIFVHFHGTYHSQKHSGIVSYIKQEQPNLKTYVIASVESESLEYQTSWKNLGDVILVIPSSMTKTH